MTELRLEFYIDYKGETSGKSIKLVRIKYPKSELYQEDVTPLVNKLLEKRAVYEPSNGKSCYALKRMYLYTESEKEIPIKSRNSPS